MDERTPDKVITIKCSSRAQRTSEILHFFKAEQFKTFASIKNKVIYPQPPLRDNGEYWDKHYRLRVNGSWFGDKSTYHFFTADEIMDLIEEMFFDAD